MLLSFLTLDQVQDPLGDPVAIAPARSGVVIGDQVLQRRNGSFQVRNVRRGRLLSDVDLRLRVMLILLLLSSHHYLFPHHL